MGLGLIHDGLRHKKVFNGKCLHVRPERRRFKTIDLGIHSNGPDTERNRRITLQMQEDMEQREGVFAPQGTSFCAWCARMKRGVMYTTARKNGFNVLALGQHLDDLAESFLMSAFHGGRLETMKAHYRINAGDIRVIRPMVYVRERQCADFAQAAALPVVPDSCPACFRMPTQREHMKTLLAQEERHNPHVFRNLLSTLRPLMEGIDLDYVPPGKEHLAARAPSR